MIKGNKGNRVTENDIKKIINSYLSGKTIFRITRETGFNANTIKKWLIKRGIEIKIGKHNKPKTGFTDKEKNKIINLYVNQKRGADYIGKLFSRSDRNITYWLNKWGVKKNTRSEISLKIREIYGITKGFKGRKHKEISKQKTSKSSIESWQNTNRIANHSKSKFFSTSIGKVLGSYEVAYLQGLIENNEQLPIVCKKRFKTPFGSYMPDFEFDDKFIEIKSDFTLKVASGLIKNIDGELSNTQFKKIKWLGENVKPVEIIVLKQQESLKLLKRAVESGFVKDKVIIKNTTYKIL